MHSTSWIWNLVNCFRYHIPGFGAVEVSILLVYLLYISLYYNTSKLLVLEILMSVLLVTFLLAHFFWILIRMDGTRGKNLPEASSGMGGGGGGGSRRGMGRGTIFGANIIYSKTTGILTSSQNSPEKPSHKFVSVLVDNSKIRSFYKARMWLKGWGICTQTTTSVQSPHPRATANRNSRSDE